MRPKLAKGCMGINPDGVALEGPSARAISLPKEEADHYWALVAAAKDAPLDLDKDSSSGSESEEEPDQPAPQVGDGPHQPDRTTPDHFVFDVSHQEEITTPSREVPAMTEDLESTPGSSKSPRTGKASSPPPTHSQKRKKSVANTVAPVVETAVPLVGTSSTARSPESDDMSSPPPAHSQKRKKSVASTVAPVVATAVPLAGTSSTAQSHESDDMSSPPPTHNTQKRKKSVSSAVARAMPSFMPQAETVHPHAPEPSGSTSQPVAGPSNAASVPSPPSLDTEEWARVYTRMAEVVGAAVREGLAAGFEFFGKELAKQHKDIKKSLSDTAEVQVAILRQLNPDRPGSTSRRDPEPRHRSPVRRQGDGDVRRRRSRTPEKKRRRDSRDN